MSFSYEVLIGLRQLKGRNRSKSVSVLTIISILGVVMGVWALTVVQSVLSGFGQDLRKKIIESTPNMEVDRHHGELVRPKKLCAKIKGVVGVKSCSAFISNEMMLSSSNNMSGVLLRGIEASAARIKSLTGQMRAGKFNYLFAPKKIPRPPQVRSLSDFGATRPGPLVRDPYLSPFPTPQRPAPLRLKLPGKKGKTTPKSGFDDPFKLPPELDPGSPIGRAKAPRRPTSRRTRPAPARGPDTRPAPTPKAPKKAPDARGPQGKRKAPPAARQPAIPNPIVPQQPREPSSRPAGRKTPPAKRKSDAARNAQDDNDDNDDKDAFVLPFERPTPPKKKKEKVYPGILLGQELAKNLGISVGEVIRAISPLGGTLTPMGPAPRVQRFRVAGVFYTGMYEYDTKFAFVTLASAQKLFKMEGIVSGLELGLVDIYTSSVVKKDIRRVLGGGPYRVRDWVEMNSQLFGALQMEKFAMFLILALIVLVASFNIVSTLTMVVLEKAEEIAILKSMGATRSSIMKIFMIEGLAIGVVGTVIGLFLGWRTCIFLINHPIQMNQDVYYIAHLPVLMNASDFVSVAIAAIIISFLATVYPALQAARLHPVEGLQHE